MTRAEKVKKALQLRARGLTQNEIAWVLGVARSTAASYCTDPDFAKQRQRRSRYAGRCVDCGAPTDGSNGRARAAKRCLSCQNNLQVSAAKWTPENLILAAQAWANEHGRPPRAKDWRNATDTHPAFSQCYQSSTSANKQVPWWNWADFIEAAGFPRPQVGKYVRTEETRRRMSASQRDRWARART